MFSLNLTNTDEEIIPPTFSKEKVVNQMMSASIFRPWEKIRMGISGLKLRVKYSYKEKGPLEAMHSSPMNHALMYAVSGSIIYDREFVYLDIEGRKESLAQMVLFIAEATGVDLSEIKRHTYKNDKSSNWFHEVVL